MKSIFIFRRDFRLTDNIGLIKACKNNERVYPIFIFTPEQIKKNDFKSSNAVQFMIESLKDLDSSLKKHGSKLNLYYSDYLDVIEDLVKTNNITNVYTNTDYTPYAIKREKEIDKLSKRIDFNFCYYDDVCIFKPGTILNGSDKYYQKFTPFYKSALKEKFPKVKKLKKKYKEKLSYFKNNKYSISFEEAMKFYDFNENLHVKGGRKNAKKIIKDVKKFSNYDDIRNILISPTTNLSAYLKFGCLSIREVFQKFKENLGINDPIIRQLFWREFYYNLGYGFIERFGKELKEQYSTIKWSDNKKYLDKWKEGKTGFPIVDACMTQLNQTGYMHNRGRLIVASFLIKNLQIDWRAGEKYFAQQLLDYDPLVNQGNWQWVAGTGADSQPYFRIFNPMTQSSKFDKEAEYIKKWLPNLKDVPAKHLHDWNKFYQDYDLTEIKYVEPMIDYKKSRDVTFKMYKKGLGK
jgi:deoxyribodipyrimidine photo-lyase